MRRVCFVVFASSSFDCVCFADTISSLTGATVTFALVVLCLVMLNVKLADSNSMPWSLCLLFPLILLLYVTPLTCFVHVASARQT
jgi:hypothetical protein